MGIGIFNLRNSRVPNIAECLLEGDLTYPRTTLTSVCKMYTQIGVLGLKFFHLKDPVKGPIHSKGPHTP